MKLNIDIGQPEILLLCGTFLMTNNHFEFGLTLLILGFLGGIFRASLRLQAVQKEIESKEKIFKEMSDAGEELGSALATLFGAFKSGNDKKNHGIVH